MLTEEMWGMIQSASIAIVFLSRVPQIMEIFMKGETGALAFATVLLGWAGSIARLSTVLIESDDIYYRIPFILSAAFLSIIMLQFAYYWNSDKKVDDKKKDGKKVEEGAKPKKDTKKT